MKKVIVLSTVLGLSALGMACGDSGTNVNVNAKSANVSTPAPISTSAPVSTPTANLPASNSGNMKPSNTTTTPASNMKPANMMKTPVPSPTKKP